MHHITEVQSLAKETGVLGQSGTKQQAGIISDHSSGISIETIAPVGPPGCGCAGANGQPYVLHNHMH